MAESLEGKIQITDIEIEFPDKPYRTLELGNIRSDEYNIIARVKGVTIGSINISYDITPAPSFDDIDDLYFNLDEFPQIVRRPVVTCGEIEHAFRGKSITGMIVTLANPLAKNKFYGEPLASDYLFAPNITPHWKELGYHPNPGKRTWEKLQGKGLAYKRTYEGRDRWIMR